MAAARQVYVISDMHLGGAYASGTYGEQRGFRLCSQVPTLTSFVEALSRRPSDTQRTELIINGDFVDFLAEGSVAEGAPARWVPFITHPRHAAETLKAIVDRDRPFFLALADFLHRGHRLVILLGNHDLELSLPFVRETLRDELRVRGCDDFQIIYDGEAYAVGGALIEHGNQYDEWNRVDHASLRKLRSLQSRHSPDVAGGEFRAPPGSRLVSDVINPLKADYQFIDLLKPETKAVVPLLLALDPGYRRLAAELAALSVTRVIVSAQFTITGDIASSHPSSRTVGGDLVARPNDLASDEDSRLEDDALRLLLEDVMPGKSPLFLASLDAHVGGDIAAGDSRRVLGLLQLIAGNRKHLLERRLTALRAALEGLQGDPMFDRGTESFTEYLEAATTLAGRGFRFVIFGHTHLARDVQLGGGARYLNSGTWADLIRFPENILTSQNDEELLEFVVDMSAGRLSRWLYFAPTYVRLDVNGDGIVSNAELVEYRLNDPV
jgi:UDP-2,3-diacylglucosamine pyrophosphatase LpxH